MLEKLKTKRDVLPTQRSSETKFGTQITPQGVRFRLWAPQCDAVGLKLENEAAVRPMRALPRGWFELEVEGAAHGTLYRFVVADGTTVPDPASRFQPQDVLGPSEVIDPRLYPWMDVGWTGQPWEETVVYELHIGTFTPEGTFAAAMHKLDHLVDLGITAIELMPVNDFPGRWNWGYDGALQFAPDSRYGRPEELKALIDAAHQHNLMVLLDAVYNHFGPKGNFLPHYAPVFTEKHTTPWGNAMNFDGPGSDVVREFILANARYWLIEYHFDGLRLDAVHEIKDEGFNHVLHDLALQIRGSTDGRYVHLVVENELNDPDWMRRTEDGRAGLYDGQWNDDIHHLIDVVINGDRSNYLADYATHEDWLPRALAEGFGYQGETLPGRQGQGKGAPSSDLPPVAFVDFIQNHDQIGNRLFGERIASLVEPQRMRAAAALYLLSPHIPLIFMGEEWGAKTPFLFFSDVDQEFAEDIRTQRQAQFSRFVPEDKIGVEPPDAMAESSFRASKLDWSEPEQPEHAELLDLYRKLLDIRRREIVPWLAGIGGGAGRNEILDFGIFRVQWRLNGAQLMLVANLSDAPAEVETVFAGRRLWLEGEATATTLGAWSVAWSISEDGA